MKDPQRYLALSIILDFVLVILFAVIGRASHREDLGVAGVVQTAWPFLVGTVVGWLATLGWRRPLSIVRTGIGVWAATVVIGILLRAASGQNTAGSFTAEIPFIIVAAVTLAVLLLGWRAIAILILRRRARRPAKG